MRTFFIFLTGGLLSASAYSQSAADSVKNTINNLFSAMRAADGNSLKNTFAPGAIMQTVSGTKEGKTVVSNENIDDFAASVSQLGKDSADERIVFETVKTDGPLAIAWTPYRFYYNGRFSHCGVDAFQLVRIGGEWRIQYLIDTRRRTGCSP